ncbi:fimbrillin family protein [Parabacteroides sp.]
MKQTILYAAISGMCLLTACQEEEYEPAAVTDKEILSLTVSANDFAVVGGISTRAADNGITTTFENGDRVGVIVLDGSGNIIANNVPYRYNSSTWDFDTSDGDGKQPAYYDPSITSYIVYYPYDAEANNIASVDALKALDAFTPQTDQSAEDAYRKSDLMVWYSTGKPMKRIAATLSHIRASFSLAPTVRLTVDTGDGVSYIPSVLKDVFIYDSDGESLVPNRAEDGSYRYILPDDYTGKLRWFYTYKGQTFGGEREVAGNNQGIRYAQVEIIDVGEYSTYTLDRAVMGDFYCTAETDGGKVGYVIPWEAAFILDRHNCIGIVFYTGKHEKDNSDYTKPLTENGSMLPEKTFHGYVVALTDVHNDKNDGLKWEWGPNREWKENVGTSTSQTDWNGYSNSLIIHEFVQDKSSDNWEMKHFPAALACETFSERTLDHDSNPITDGRYDWQQPFMASKNSSGWFSPSCGQLYYLWQNRVFLAERINEVKNKTTDNMLKNHIKWFTGNPYWSSTGKNPSSIMSVPFSNGEIKGAAMDWNYCVRAILAF